MGNGDAGKAEQGHVPPETSAAVQQLIADTSILKRLLDDLHPAEDDTVPLRALAAAMSLSGHAGVEEARGKAEKDRSVAEKERFQAIIGQRPVPGFVRSTGLSLERLANSAAERYPYGWHLKFHVPGELLEDDPKQAGGKNRAWWIAGLLIMTVLAAGLIALLAIEDSRQKHLTSSTAGVAAVVGGWVAVVLLPALAWVGLVRWRSARDVSIDLEREAPAAWVLAGIPGGAAAPESGGAVPATAGTQTASSSSSGNPGSNGTSPATSAGSLVSREPVLVGSLLTGGGTLALGLSGALGTSALGAVSAGAIAVTALLVRELVTPTKSK